ncbi:hypothetical protein MLD38_031432 [Melastoma candidum]|uniref:Uncharacterized protein n=1 Tax=Melastoma candidum TaxID=119954 RepID=A0ACB9MPN7_9MYRT|nr:hypothetical protein MLD38_031432 [Melastoma candidum]
MDEPAPEPRPMIGRRRSRGPEATAREEALQRLKAIRSGGAGAAVAQIKIDDPIYDTVEEDEYDKLVAKRREEVKGFIVDDDGLLGYADDGEEEDWTRAGSNWSSEEEGEDGGSKVEKVKKKKTEKKDAAVKKPGSSSLLAAAELIGKQRLSSMFTSSVFKKTGGRDDKVKGVSCDSIVDDVIAEFAPDESDRLRRRRVHAGARSVLPVREVKCEKESPDFDNFTRRNLSVDVSEKGDIVPNSVGSGDISDNCLAKEPKEGLLFEGNNCGKLVDCAQNTEGIEILNVDKNLDYDEVKSDPTVKKEQFHTLNAKTTEEKNPALSATAGWKEVITGHCENINGVADLVLPTLNFNEKLDFELDVDGSMPFYMLDAHEEIYGANAGNVYLFGKVKTGSTYQSCCVVVKQMQRCVYAIPHASAIDSFEMAKLEKAYEESQISSSAFRAKLLDLAYQIKNEVTKHLLDLNVSSFSMALVKRRYAFERPDIPVGENYVLKINYPFKDPPLPVDLKGESFSVLHATHCSALELLLVKRKIKGPSWLSISNFSSCANPQRVSWCKFEVTVESPKDLRISASTKFSAEIPPVVVTAINLKTIANDKNNVNEIVSASIIRCQKAKIDTPMLPSEWKKPNMLSHFTVVRKLEGGIFPMGFTKEATEKNAKAGSNVIGFESSERALLNRVMIELHKLDSDVLVGHNISGFDLEVLLQRAQACKVPSTMWSKIGRLKRSVMPRLTRGSNIFGSGASPGIMSCVAGRLLCDTYLCSRDLLKEVSYSLTQLAKTQLNKDRKEITPHDLPRMFQNTTTLMELIEYGETDAWLSMELMFHLSILPLTRQLTNISGNLWGRTLQGARAQRVEYLLLHAFHAKKYIVPDKTPSKDSKFAKKRTNHGDGEQNIDGLDADEERQSMEQQKGKKGPAYLGGLVLEPKRGLYDKYVLLLDFNSLYPSIIQEYNICFTTVERAADGSIPPLPSSKDPGVLPELLKNLVQRRRMVKSWMKNATGLKVQQLDIQQQALKLTANSMYGCLGFSNSRFYAKPLAELITLQARQILQSTVDLVQNNLNLEVIYGDTDSIMIYSGLDDISKAKAIAGKVIQEVNKKYRCLEIDLDGLYKRMLLLKKKKYAAVKLHFKDGTPYEVIERKGLDMVRRDWSLLSKELGDFCLSQILSGGSCEDVVESIHDSLVKVAEDMRRGQVALEKYVITKTLTKPPEAYPDAKNQPHVQVAMRLKQSGYSIGCSVGDTVPYIICREQGAECGSSTGIAPRARHPDELKQNDGKWLIDIDYYLSQQIHPVVSRLCASIQGTSPERLADCLGLDSSKFQVKSNEPANNVPSGPLFSMEDEERYRDCRPLILSCPSCSTSFNCPAICNSICESVSRKSNNDEVEKSSSFWCSLHCPKCPKGENMGTFTSAILANQVKRQADGFMSQYYKCVMMCDDESCNHTTRSLNLRVLGDSERGTICPEYPRCNGHLVRKYSEADLYKQLSYFCHILDTERFLDKVDSRIKVQVDREITRIRHVVESAASIVRNIRDRCGYGWVQMRDLFVL